VLCDKNFGCTSVENSRSTAPSICPQTSQIFITTHLLPVVTETDKIILSFSSRYKKFHSLTLIGEDGQHSTVNITSTRNVQESENNEDAIVYLGGLPPGVLVRTEFWNC
jgi:hypothetical protein